MAIRTLVTLMAALSVGATFAGDVFRWNGGAAGDFSKPSNWLVGTAAATRAPGAGDQLLFDGADAVTANNDIDGLTVASLWLMGPGAVTLKGGEIALTGGAAALTNACAATIYAPLRAAANNTWYMKSPIDIYGKVTIDAGFKLTSAGPDNLSSVTYHGPVAGPQATFQHAQGKGGNLYFMDRVELATLSFNWGAARLHLAENAYLQVANPIGLWYAYIVCDKHNAFDPSVAFTWRGDYRESGDGRSSYDISSTEQTIDRVYGTAPKNGKGEVVDSDFLLGSGTLTLRLSEDATACCRIKGSLSLVVDSPEGHTQTFMDRAHVTTGTITVKKGGLTCGGTNTFANLSGISVSKDGVFTLDTTSANALAGLKSLEIFSKGKFVIGENAATPFGDKTLSLWVNEDSELTVPAGLTIDVASLHVGGARLTAAVSYTGEGGPAGAEVVPWIKGTGVVHFDPAAETVTEWTGAVDNNWGTAGNWTKGVPDATHEAVVYSGKPVIAVADVASFKNVTITSRLGSSPELHLSGTHDFTGFKATVGRGGQLFVDAGSSLSFANSAVTVENGGRIEFADQTAVTETSTPIFSLAHGAVLDIKGSCAYTPYAANHTFASDGVLRFGGTSTYEHPTQSSRHWISSATVAGTNRIEFLGSSTMSGKAFDQFVIQENASGIASLLIDTTETLHFGNALMIGRTKGSGEVTLDKGGIYCGYYGLKVGTSAAGYTTRAVGRLSVNNGIVFLDGSANGRDSIDGLVVGDGSVCGLQGSLIEGYMDLNGGAVTNQYQPTVVGVGRSVGVVRQNGGVFCQLSYKTTPLTTRSLVVGLAGGTGTWTMNGGVCDARKDVWIGGAPADAVASTLKSIGTNPMPSATGTFEVNGGTLNVAGTLTVGAYGSGTLAIGANGTVTAANLSLPNADTSVLAFNLGETTAGMLTVSGQMSVTTGSKLVVDASKYTLEKSVWLLKAESATGAFDADDVTLIRGNDRQTLRVNAEGVRLCANKGVLLIFR